MKKLINGDAYIALQGKGELILNTILSGIKINYENYYTNVELSFIKKENDNLPSIIINMKKIKFFDFVYGEDIYYIVDYKIIFEDNKYYLSLDPYNSTNNISDSDGGIVISEFIEIIFLDPQI